MYDLQIEWAYSKGMLLRSFQFSGLVIQQKSILGYLFFIIRYFKNFIEVFVTNLMVFKRNISHFIKMESLIFCAERPFIMYGMSSFIWLCTLRSSRDNTRYEQRPIGLINILLGSFCRTIY